MNDSNLLQTLGQVSSGSAGEALRDHLRGMVRQMITYVITDQGKDFVDFYNVLINAVYVDGGSGTDHANHSFSNLGRGSGTVNVEYGNLLPLD